MLPPGETIDAWLGRNGFGNYAFAIKGYGYTELSFLADAGEELVEKLIGSLDMPEPVANSFRTKWQDLRLEGSNAPQPPASQMGMSPRAARRRMVSGAETRDAHQPGVIMAQALDEGIGGNTEVRGPTTVVTAPSVDVQAPGAVASAPPAHEMAANEGNPVDRSPALRRTSTRRLEKLKELKSLKQDGILDEDEFQEEKKRILAEEGA